MEYTTNIKAVIATVVMVIIAIILGIFSGQKAPEAGTTLQERIVLGSSLLEEGKYQEAIEWYLEILDTAPTNIPSYTGLAQAYLNIGEKDMAIKILEHCYEGTGDKDIYKMLEQLEETYIDYVIKWVEPDFEQNIRDMIKKTEGDIWFSEVVGISEVSLFDTEMRSVEDLVHFTNLEKFYLRGGNINNLTPISGLTKLTSLTLQGCNIRNITPLASLVNLETLSLSSNSVSDLSPIGGLTNLTWLVLENNQIRDITPIGNLTKMYSLGLENNVINDLSGLSTLKELYWLGDRKSVV